MLISAIIWCAQSFLLIWICHARHKWCHVLNWFNAMVGIHYKYNVFQNMLFWPRFISSVNMHTVIYEWHDGNGANGAYFILVLILLTNTKNIFTLDIRNWDSFRIKICCFIGIQYADWNDWINKSVWVHLIWGGGTLGRGVLPGCGTTINWTPHIDLVWVQKRVQSTTRARQRYHTQQWIRKSKLEWGAITETTILVLGRVQMSRCRCFHYSTIN